MAAERRIALAIIFGALVWYAPLSAQVRSPGSEHTPPAFTFHKIRDDLYHAVGTGNLAVGANAAVVINEADVLLVDSHVSPAAAHVLLEELKAITTKPVRYVVNTHFHFDHTHGNQVYPAGVEIIGHELTREALASGASMRGRGYERFIGGLPQQIAALRAQLDTATTAATRADLERRIRIQENYRAATAAVRATPSTVAFDSRLTARDAAIFQPSTRPHQYEGISTLSVAAAGNPGDLETRVDYHNIVCHRVERLDRRIHTSALVDPCAPQVLGEFLDLRATRGGRCIGNCGVRLMASSCAGPL